MPEPEIHCYTITFDRIGRRHDVGPLIVTGTEREMANAVYELGGRFLVSSDYDVLYSVEEGKGFFLCGAQSGGNFTIEAVDA